MAITVQGQVGPQVLQDGATQAVQLGKNAEIVVTEYHGKYYTQSYRGRVFTATQAAAVIMLPTTGATASFCVANPAGSGVNLSLVRFEMIVTSPPGTPVVGGYMLNVTANTVAAAVTGTAIVPTPGLIGTNYQPAGKAFTTATMPATPTFFRTIASKLTGAATTIPYLAAFAIDFDGTAILTPGSAIGLQQISADTTNASAVATMIWEEVAL